MLTHAEKIEKWKLLTIAVLYFLIGYMPINYLNQYREHYFDVSLPFESSIPFVAASIFGYLLVYLSLLFTHFVIDDIKDYRRAFTCYILTISVCLVFFIFIPVKIDRPDLSNAKGFFNEITKFYYIIDKPYNLFPSLHVAYPVLGTLLVWKRHHRAGIILAIATLIIAVSVVLVKQHYIIDTVTGTLTAILCYKLTVWTERYWSQWFKPWSGPSA